MLDGPREERQWVFDREQVVDVAAADEAKRDLKVGEGHGVVTGGGDLSLVWSMYAE